MPSKTKGGRIMAGILLLLTGTYLLLRNFGLLPFDLPEFFFSWQSLLILLGLVVIGTSENKGGGIMLILVGVIFLIHDIFYVSMKDILRFWPLLLIAIGALVLLGRGQRKKVD